MIVIGVDIGGTKIKAAAVEIGSGKSGGRLVVAEQVPTPRTATEAFYDVVAALVRKLRDRAKEGGEAVQPYVAIAHPGRLLSDGTLARGTTPNLGTRPGEFDGVDPAEELRRRLGGMVFAENDAVAQMRFGLDALLRDPGIRPRLLERTVVYLGPGTGMGGGAARVGRQGEVSVITDGHFFDMRVPGYADGTLTAEELLTGQAIAHLIAEANTRLSQAITPATAEQLSRLLADSAAPSEQRDEAGRIADLQGEILALIIEAIRAGRITKVRLEPLDDGRLVRHVDEPDRAWPEPDKAAVRGTDRFILGGSVGADPVLGGRLRARAIEILRQRGLGDVAIFQIPLASADAGLLGVIHAIPTGQLHR